MKTAIIMSEPPAPCGLDCEYCYITPAQKDHFAADRKMVTADDYLRLARLTGADRYVFWLCGCGEPLLRPDTAHIVAELSQDHKVVIISSLAVDHLPSGVRWENFGAYWSIHYDQMEVKPYGLRALAHAWTIKKRGGRVWGTLVAHSSELKHTDEVVRMCDSLSIPLLPCRYRYGQGALADHMGGLRDRFAPVPAADLNLWDLTPRCWDVAGGLCTSGSSVIVVDNNWDVVCCHGDRNKTVYGKFPEDLDTMRLEPTRRCLSSVCPCKHMVMWGVNNRHPISFGDILPGWEGFANA